MDTPISFFAILATEISVCCIKNMEDFYNDFGRIRKNQVSFCKKRIPEE